MIVLDPNRSFISFKTYYVEQAHGIKIVPQQDGAQCVETTWKRPTWKEQNIVYAQSMYQSGINLEIDGLKYQIAKLKMCLKKWDAKDDNGKPIPLTESTIDNLDPVIAAELIRQFDTFAEPSETDFKRLDEIAKRFYEGRKPHGMLPQYIYEHLLAKHYGWSLKEIREMDHYDFMVHLRLCIIAEGKENEFQATLHGGGKRKITAEDILRKKAQQTMLSREQNNASIGS